MRCSTSAIWRTSRPGEFIGAGLWQLFKGIESPYKSVLKLLLTEVYASEHPQVAVPEPALQEGGVCQPARPRRAGPLHGGLPAHRGIPQCSRRAGASGTGTPQSVPEGQQKAHRRRRQRNNSWQRLLLERLTKEWGWDERQLALLDSRSQWKVRQVTTERRALVNELNYSYRFLTQFARTEQAVSVINKRDLNVLGRRLYAAFERKAGKVEFINPGIAPDLAEDTLTLVHSPNRRAGQTQWGLYNGSLNAQEWEHFAPIKRSRELLELLTWCHRNNVIDSSTRLALHPGSSDLTEFELFNLLGSLQQTIALPLTSVSEESLLRPSVPERSAATGQCRHRSAQTSPRPECPDDHRAHRLTELCRGSGKPGTDPRPDHPQQLE